jgi:hypothetical protein
MSVRVWLSGNTLHYPQGGGHMWVFSTGLSDSGNSGPTSRQRA